MLRYKTETRPGLVALYDIQPGNGAGPFLHPRSPHGALGFMDMILSLRLGFLRGVFLPSHLASTDNLTRTTKR